MEGEYCTVIMDSLWYIAVFTSWPRLIMCGRILLIEDLHSIAKRYEAEPVLNEWKPRYNIAPNQTVLAVISNQGKRKLVGMTFGFSPNWSKKSEAKYIMINAKAETIAEKPSFSTSFRNKRCLIPVNGFYEWETAKTGKFPYKISLKEGVLFSLAGIWDDRIAPDGKSIYSMAIITTEANELLAPLHNRMPVILHEKDESLWLDQSITQPEKLKPLLVPYPSVEMERCRVSSLVNSWRNDGPECLLPV